MNSIAACLALAAALNHLPAKVLPAIQAVEGGDVGTVVRNRDGSADLGPLQVNTLWIPTIAVATGETAGTVRNRLINDACYNATIGGAILANELDETHGDLWRAIGYYHSHLPVEGSRYALQVGMAAVKQSLEGRRP